MSDEPEKSSELKDHHFVEHNDILEDHNDTQTDTQNGHGSDKLDKTNGIKDTESERPEPTKGPHPIFVVVMVSLASPLMHTSPSTYRNSNAIAGRRQHG